MGLDQYLKYRTPKQGPDECEDIAYFRKVNALHGWVQDHANDGKEHNCDEIPLSLELLRRLKSDVETAMNDPERASEVFPTTGGFFFGTYDYDEWYLRELKDVQVAVDKAIAVASEGGQVFYWSWW